MTFPKGILNSFRASLVAAFCILLGVCIHTYRRQECIPPWNLAKVPSHDPCFVVSVGGIADEKACAGEELPMSFFLHWHSFCFIRQKHSDVKVCAREKSSELVSLHEFSSSPYLSATFWREDLGRRKSWKPVLLQSSRFISAGAGVTRFVRDGTIS